MRDCGACKCYVCGHPQCTHSICRGMIDTEQDCTKRNCGRFIFDSEKLRDYLIGNLERSKHDLSSESNEG